MTRIGMLLFGVLLLVVGCGNDCNTNCDLTPAPTATVVVVAEETAEPTNIPLEMIDIVIPTSTPEPTGYAYSLDLETSYATAVADGAFRLIFTIDEVPGGSYKTSDAAITAVFEETAALRQACGVTHQIDRRTWADPLRYVVSANEGSFGDSEYFTLDCADALEQYLGYAPQNSVNQDVLTQIAQPDPGDSQVREYWIYDGVTGVFIGIWDGSYPDITQDCVQFSLNYLYKYSGGDIVVVDRKAVGTWDVLYENGLYNVDYATMYIPDLCGPGSMKIVSQPSWISKAPLSSDETVFTANDGTGARAWFSIHTETDNCNIYPSWGSGYLFTSNAEDGDGTVTQYPLVVFQPWDLILVQRRYNEEFVYLTLNNEGEFLWLAPEGRGDPLDELDDLYLDYMEYATIFIATETDGLENWIRFFNFISASSPYSLEGDMHFQQIVVPATFATR